LTVKARYDADPLQISPQSAPVTVTVDPLLRQSPTHVDAQSKAGGLIKLTWRAPADTTVQGYRIYRAPASFAQATLADLTTVPDVELLNQSELISGTAYTDFPADTEQMPYYYRLTSVTDAGIESELSDEVVGLADSLLPTAATIAYTRREGTESVDIETGDAFAPGCTIW
jgi:hypothetical protein